MPVLQRSVSRWPDHLFEEEDDGGTDAGDVRDARWWVLHTRPRAEKSVTRQLLLREIAFYLPLVQRRQRYQRRLVTSELPLFPGYVFLHGDDESCAQAFATGGVANLIRVREQEQLSADLSRIYRLLQSGATVAPESRIPVGAEVEITSGPMAGMRGRLLRGGSELQFVVAVNFLQRGASVKVDAAMVRAV